jgi:hypothetical protein
MAGSPPASAIAEAAALSDAAAASMCGGGGMLGSGGGEPAVAGDWGSGRAC